METTKCKSVLVFADDVWTNFMMGVWADFQEIEIVKWKPEQIKKAAEFMEKIKRKNFNGIIIVFNPFFYEISDIWSEFKQTEVYKTMPLLFLGNSWGISTCKKYSRENFDRAFDFCKLKGLIVLNDTIQAYLDTIPIQN
jgi:hypothetical protein